MVSVPAPRREASVCPRCGGVIAWTDEAMLRRCSELAKREAP